MSAKSGPISTMSLEALDAPTVTLIRLAATIAGGSDAEVRAALAAASDVPPRWVDELILQSYLFSGFPRALNAAREWRRMSPLATPAEGAADPALAGAWLARGETTCATVYGDMYEKLRRNVYDLHPALDAIMVMDGYGKVLGRPGLDLGRRELCIVAACAATGQERQLHSHLHGALNVGVASAALSAALDALAPTLGPDRTRSARLLLARVVGK